MRAAVRAAVLSAVLVLVTGPASSHGQPLFGAGHDPVAGAKVFTAKRCIGCHAIAGKGGTVGPDLLRTVRPRTYYDLGAALWNHAPAMAARNRERGGARPLLTAVESGNPAAYLYTLNSFDRPGDAPAGRRLFTEKKCVACHAVGGGGGTVGPALDALKAYGTPIAFAAAMWNHAGPMAAAMAERGITRPTFSGSELHDLIAFINPAARAAPGVPLQVLPGRPAEGARLMSDKRCFECHSAAARTDGTMNLAERQADQSLTGFAASMWNKMPRMAAALKERAMTLPVVRPDEMADIVAYLYAVRYFGESGDPRAGVILATYKGCLTCHGLFGERDKPASDLTRSATSATPGATLAALWNHAFIDDPRRPQDRTPWPAFTGKQMADLFAYLRSLRQ